MRVRDSSIDVVRTVGVLAIVAGHVWESPVLRDLLFTWHVPVFFFLSGYLWTAGRDLPTEITNRSRTLLKPYVFWWPVIFVPYVALLFLTDQLNLEKILGPIYGGQLAGGPFATFWFVFALFATAVLWRILERTFLWVRVAVLAVGLAAAIFIGPQLALTPLAIGMSLPALIFLAAGQVLRRYSFSRKLGLLVGVVLLAVAAALIFTDISAPLDIKKGNWGTPVLSILVAIVISWGLVLIAKAIAGKWSRWATAFALCGFTIVLVHPSIIWVTNPLDVPRLAVFIAAVIIPTAIAAVALRTPLSQWVTGVPRRVKAPVSTSI